MRLWGPLCITNGPGGAVPQTIFSNFNQSSIGSNVTPRLPQDTEHCDGVEARDGHPDAREGICQPISLQTSQCDFPATTETGLQAPSTIWVSKNLLF